MKDLIKTQTSLIDLLPDIWFRIKDGVLIEASDKLESELGIVYSGIENPSLGDLISNNQDYELLIQEVFEKGKVPVRLIEARDGFGNFKTFSVSASRVAPENSPSGEVEIVGTIRDVTEEWIEIRQEKNDFLNFVDVVNSTLDGMAIINIETGKIVDANKVALDLAGYSLGEVKSIPLTMLVSADKEEMDFFIDNLRQRGDLRFNRRLLHRSGDVVDLEVSARMMQLGDGQFFQCNIRDITLKKRLYKLGQLRGEVLRMKETGKGPEQIISKLCQQLEKICHRAGFAYISFNPELKWTFAKESNIPKEFQKKLIKQIKNHPELTLLLKKQVFNADIKFFLEKMKLESTMSFQASRWSLFAVYKGSMQDGTLVVFDQSRNEILDEEIENLGQLAHILGNAFYKIEQEERLITSEHRYRELVDHSPMGIGVYQNKKIVFANHEFYNLLGFSPRMEVGASELMDIVAHSDFQGVMGLVNTINDAGQIPITEVVLYKYNTGEEITLMIQGTIVSYQDEEAIQFVFYDITQRKEVEKQLKESQEKFELAAEGSEAGIVDHYDLKNGYMWWSPKVYELLGYENNEILSNAHVIRELMHPEDLPKLTKALNKNIFAHKLEYRLRTKSGKYKWFLGSAKAQVNKEGHPIRLVGTIIDIDQRKRAEQKLRDRERLLHATGLVAKVGGWQLEKKRKKLTWTDQTYFIYGIPSKEKITLRKLLDFYSENDRNKINQAIKNCFKGEPFELTCRLKSRSGKLLWVDFSGMPVYENGEIVKLIGAQRDLTHYIHQIEGIRENERKLRNANQLAGLGNWEWNLETDTYYLSEQLYSIIGLEKTLRPTIDMINDVMHSDSKESFAELIQSALAGEPSEKAELMIIQKNTGKVKHISVRAITERDEKGKVMKMLGTVLDISDRKRMELDRERRNLYSNVILEMNAVGLTAKNDWQLTNEYCQALVMQIGFDWVWIADQGNVSKGEFNPLAHQFSLKATSCLDIEVVVQAEDASATMKVFESGKMYTLENISSAKGLKDWKDNMSAFGFQSFISIPYVQDGKLKGAVNLYSLDKVEMDDSLKRFLSNLIHDYGNGLYALELKRNRDELNEFNKLLLDSLEVVSVSYDAYNGKTAVFGDTKNLIGYDESTFQEMLLKGQELIHPNDWENVKYQLEKTKDGGGTYDIEFRIRRPEDNKIIWLNSIGRVFWQQNFIRKIVGILINTNERKQAELDNVRAQITVRDNERIRIARSIHDSLGQTLTIASMSLDALSAEVPKMSEDRQELYKDAYDQLNEAIEEARSISHNLMPSLLMDFGLVKSIRSDVTKLNRSGKIKFEFNYDDECLRRYEQDVEVNIYNIFREAVTNILKHSKASEVNIQLNEADGVLGFFIGDNGIGYDKSKVKRKDGLGLGSIESRAIGLGADIYMDGSDGSSIQIFLDLEQ
ncbi:PAS domain S-box protein [Reichenbachiella ulvae]|uniref:histidine kinase n=1 Tax=Reichenbachiella ulvae TaxID=2980104 RepID=A0ABT3CSA7_9BACT|nr:PAS domain S-box protein [Reichenbachiella ulvae]MCV9386389.1 PAS domain S-box protein [Reichenbachiella ulvae]